MNNTEFYEKHLCTFPNNSVLLDHEDVPFFGSLPGLLRAIRSSLGLDIVFIRAGARLPDIMSRCFNVKVDGGKSPGNLVLLPNNNSAGKTAIPNPQQEEFVSSLALLLGDAYRWQQMVRKCEEELASIVQLPSVQLNETRFTETLFSILKAGSKLLRCQAASFYVLNTENNTKNNTLKLRSCWGLPEERLLDEPRLLCESLADIEAMLGQAVILNEDYLFETWKSPESFPTAICVPVMSPVTIIGTLWFFADIRRDFNDHDKYLIEIITGRISAELERAALERELAKKSA